jgi:TPR repeat protein
MSVDMEGIMYRFSIFASIFSFSLFLVVFSSIDRAVSQDSSVADCERLAAPFAPGIRSAIGVPVGQKNIANIIEVCERAVAQDSRRPLLVYYLARAYDEASIYEGEKRRNEAIRLLRLAADQGFAPAQFLLGSYYSGGYRPLKQDLREAARLYRLAADQGYAWAQSSLGHYYRVGLGGLSQDDREAARLFRLAADQGNASAQHDLAEFYRTGRGGLQKNEKEADRLEKLAVDNGYRPPIPAPPPQPTGPAPK